MVAEVDVGEVCGSACFGEASSLVLGPAVAGVAGRAWCDATLDREEPTRRAEHPSSLLETGGEVPPVVHGRQRPQDGHRTVRERKVLGRALQVTHRRGITPPPAQRTGDAKHDCRRVDADDRQGPGRCSSTDGHAWSATNVHDVVVGADVGQLDGEVRDRAASYGEGECGHETTDAGKGRVGGVMVGRQVGATGGSRWHGSTQQGDSFAGYDCADSCQKSMTEQHELFRAKLLGYFTGARREIASRDLDRYLRQGFTGRWSEHFADTDHQNRITERDLIAIQMLSVTAPPGPTIWILEEGANQLTELLEQIPTGVEIWKRAQHGPQVETARCEATGDAAGH